MWKLRSFQQKQEFHRRVKQPRLHFVNSNFNHLQRRLRAVATSAIRWCAFNLRYDVHARDDFTEDRVLRGAWREPIEVRVVHRVDEELRATGVRLTGIRHRQRTGFVRDFRIGRMLVFDATKWRIAGTTTRRVWIF